jgi:hypothetical protein
MAGHSSAILFPGLVYGPITSFSFNFIGYRECNLEGYFQRRKDTASGAAAEAATPQGAKWRATFLTGGTSQLRGRISRFHLEKLAAPLVDLGAIDRNIGWSGNRQPNSTALNAGDSNCDVAIDDYFFSNSSGKYQHAFSP